MKILSVFFLAFHLSLLLSFLAQQHVDGSSLCLRLGPWSLVPEESSRASLKELCVYGLTCLGLPEVLRQEAYFCLT